jgi:methanogenic corrinoid protein MtbC1
MSGNRVSADALRDRLWRAVIEGSEYHAVDVIRAGCDAGWGEEGLLLDVVAAVQAKIGVEWAADRITVAQEHAATAINERVITALVHRPEAGGPVPPHRGRVTVTCVDGEWHAFPARLVAEVLRLRGWRVDYLGAQTPTHHLVAHQHRTDSDAVLLSGSVPTHLPAAHAAITACQAVGVPVLAGGRAFGEDGRYARALGADAWAPDARGAAAALEAGLPRPTAVRQVVDDLPHLADQEYTAAVQSRSRLVKQVLTELENRFPAMRDYSEAQRERTAEDLVHIVDFLATALYVDDPEVFTGFLDWTAEVLQARGVPVHSLVTGVDVLAEQLHDFPRGLRLAHEGAAGLRGRPTGAVVPGTSSPSAAPCTGPAVPAGSRRPPRPTAQPDPSTGPRPSPGPPKRRRTERVRIPGHSATTSRSAEVVIRGSRKGRPAGPVRGPPQEDGWCRRRRPRHHHGVTAAELTPDRPLAPHRTASRILCRTVCGTCRVQGSGRRSSVSGRRATTPEGPSVRFGRVTDAGLPPGSRSTARRLRLPGSERMIARPASRSSRPRWRKRCTVDASCPTASLRPTVSVSRFHSTRE